MHMSDREKIATSLDEPYRFNLAEMAWFRVADNGFNETLSDLTFMPEDQFNNWVMQIRIARATVTQDL